MNGSPTCTACRRFRCGGLSRIVVTGADGCFDCFGIGLKDALAYAFEASFPHGKLSAQTSCFALFLMYF